MSSISCVPPLKIMGLGRPNREDDEKEKENTARKGIEMSPQDYQGDPDQGSNRSLGDRGKAGTQGGGKDESEFSLKVGPVKRSSGVFRAMAKIGHKKCLKRLKREKVKARNARKECYQLIVNREPSKPLSSDF